MDIHKWTFQGVDTSHFIEPKEGDTKIVNGIEYEYVLVNGLLKLIPAYELQEKRERRRKGAEVTDGIPSD